MLKEKTKNYEFYDKNILLTIFSILIFLSSHGQVIRIPFFQKTGAKIETIFVSEGGHGIIDKENLAKFLTWLKNI